MVIDKMTILVIFLDFLCGVYIIKGAIKNNKSNKYKRAKINYK